MREHVPSLVCSCGTFFTYPMRDSVVDTHCPACGVEWPESFRDAVSTPPPDPVLDLLREFVEATAQLLLSVPVMAHGLPAFVALTAAQDRARALLEEPHG